MRATQSGSRKRAKRPRDHSKNNHAFNKSIKRAPLCGRPAWLALDSIQDCPTARSVGTQEQRRAQILGNSPTLHPKSQPAAPHFAWQGPGRVSSRGGRCQFNTGFCRSARWANRCQLPTVDPTALVEEAQLSRMPIACLVKPVAAWADFLGPTWDSPIGGLLLQPAVTGRPRLSPVGHKVRHNDARGGSELSSNQVIGRQQAQD